MRGPSLPAGVSDRYAWEPDEEAAQRNRRSVYVLAKRNLRYPLFEAFDQPDLHQSCPRRAVTVTAPQSLAMLNSELTLELAHSWAERLVAEHGDSPHELIQAAYRAAFSREATTKEIELVRTIPGRRAANDRQSTSRRIAVAAPDNSASMRSLPFATRCLTATNSLRWISQP